MKTIFWSVLAILFFPAFFSAVMVMVGLLHWLIHGVKLV